jgi:fluoride exporter
MTKYLAIALGGALGALARYLLGSFVLAHTTAAQFPYGTFIINITGSFIIGIFLTLANALPAINEHWRLAIAVGFVGAYTTFSTFEYETLRLIEEGYLRVALLYVTASFFLGLLAVWSGAALAKKFY